MGCGRGASRGAGGSHRRSPSVGVCDACLCSLRGRAREEGWLQEPEVAWRRPHGYWGREGHSAPDRADGRRGLRLRCGTRLLRLRLPANAHRPEFRTLLLPAPSSAQIGRQTGKWAPKGPEILADEAGLSETPQYRKLHQGMKRCDNGNGIQTGRTRLGMRLCLVRRVGRDGSSPEVILLANPIVAPEWLSYVLQSHFLR